MVLCGDFLQGLALFQRTCVGIHVLWLFFVFPLNAMYVALPPSPPRQLKIQKSTVSFLLLGKVRC